MLRRHPDLLTFPMSEPIAFDPPKPDELSDMLDGYEVTELIATGGMGAVYRATQLSLDRPVAIKLLPSELNDASFRDQFQAEARSMAKLNHPNLIGIYDFGQTNGMPYIVMELVAGNSLYYSSYGKTLDQTTACEIIIGICRGLAHAHAAGIIHRDIKPANILLDSEAKPKIGDFGLAAPSDSDDEDGLVYGTPGYAAPEILVSSKAIGIASDLYAVGVILYELLTGKMPEEPARPPSVVCKCDSRLDAIFRQATRRNPAMRYQSAATLADDLEKLLPSLGKGNRPTMRTGASSKASNPITLKKKTSQVTLTPVSQKRPEAQSVSLNQKEPEVQQVASPQIAPIETASNWPIIRNLMIIAVLIPTIIFAWGKFQDKKERLQKEKNAQELKEKAADALREARLRQEREEAEQRARIAEERRIRQADPSQQDHEASGKEPSDPSAPEKTPLQQLAELQKQLAGGNRSQYPEGTIDRSTYNLFIVPTPMTWSEAAEFAEEHGAHLATPLTNADRDVIASRMKGNFERVWIGAGAQGKGQWAWVTGEPWTYRNPATTLGSCASMTRTGIIKARPNGEKNPFVIQWSVDGSNPGSIADQLRRLAPTLKTPSPEWPPTAIAQDNRVFFLITKPLSWDEADFMATAAGGHLAVISDPLEASFLTNYLNQSLSEQSSVWLGGRRKQDLWMWSTGETWQNNSWKSQSPDGGTEDSALRFLKDATGSGLDDSDPSAGQTQGFLIEWSSDATHAKASGNTTESSQGDNEIADLRGIGRRVVIKEVAKHKNRLIQNQRALVSDLTSWLRTQTKSTRDQFTGPITALEEALPTGGNLPPKPPVPNLPAETTKYYQSALARQTRFQSEHREALELLRQSFLTKLLTLRDEFEQNGQKTKVAKIDEQLSAVGQSPESFQAYFD